MCTYNVLSIKKCGNLIDSDCIYLLQLIITIVFTITNYTREFYEIC